MFSFLAGDSQVSKVHRASHPKGSLSESLPRNSGRYTLERWYGVPVSGQRTARIARVYRGVYCCAYGGHQLVRNTRKTSHDNAQGRTVGQKNSW